jgi:hypothetical protein
VPGLPDELMSWASLLHFRPIPDVPAYAPRGGWFRIPARPYSRRRS